MVNHVCTSDILYQEHTKMAPAGMNVLIPHALENANDNCQPLNTSYRHINLSILFLSAYCYMQTSKISCDIMYSGKNLGGAQCLRGLSCLLQIKTREESLLLGLLMHSQRKPHWQAAVGNPLHLGLQIQSHFVM